MEAPDIARYVGVFLGGGLAKTLVDHLLADRRERRSGLRPRDRERIEAIRSMTETLPGSDPRRTSSGFPTRSQRSPGARWSER